MSKNKTWLKYLIIIIVVHYYYFSKCLGFSSSYSDLFRTRLLSLTEVKTRTVLYISDTDEVGGQWSSVTQTESGQQRALFTQSSRTPQASVRARETPLKSPLSSVNRLNAVLGLLTHLCGLWSVVSVSLWIQQKLSDPLQTTCTCRLTECIEEELFICHITNYTEYNQQWNVFAVFNPSKCTHTWSSGHTHTHTPMLRRPGSSWGFGALLKGLTSVVDNSCRSRDSNPQPWVTSPTLYPLGLDCIGSRGLGGGPRSPGHREHRDIHSSSGPIAETRETFRAVFKLQRMWNPIKQILQKCEAALPESMHPPAACQSRAGPVSIHQR